MSMHDVMDLVDDRELSELWHLSRVVTSDKHARKVWVAAKYHELHPDHGSETGVYKAMERFGIGELTLTPAQAKLVDQRAHARALAAAASTKCYECGGTLAADEEGAHFSCMDAGAAWSDAHQGDD